MGNANPRYLRAWPDEQLNAGGAAIVYGTAADLAAGVDAVKLYNAATLAGASVKVFGSIADDGKFVKVTSTGKIDLSLLPLTSALVYRGTEQPASAAPVAPAVGDVYLLDAAGTFGASWGPLAGQTGMVGDQLIYDGTKWNLIAADDTGVISITAGSGLTGGLISSVGTIAVDYGTSADLLAGTDTVKLYNAATLAGASTTASAGAGDAGKFVKLDPTGKIDATLLPAATGGTVTNVATGAGLTGGPITTTGTISLAASGVTAGTYKSVTVDAYGRVTAGTNPTTLAGYGITDAVPNTATVSGGTSLTGGGALSAAPLVITLVNDAAAPGAAKYYGTDGAGVKGWQVFPAAGGTGTVTSVATGTGLTGGPVTTSGTISLAPSGVTAGTAGSATQVPVFTVDTYGRITGYTNTTITPAWTDVTGKPTTLAGYGITDAVPNTAAVSGTVSLTGGGALFGAPLSISLVNDNAAPGNSYYYGTDGAGVKGWHAFPAAGGTGTVTSITAGTGLAGGTITTAGTLSLATSGVAAGTYDGFTVDTYGRVTAYVDPRHVVGPASATDNAVARYDAATGLLIQNSGVIIDDLNNVSGVVNLTTSGSTILGDAAADTYTLNGSTMAVPNNLNIDNNTLMIDAANNRVGFGTATPASQFDLVGTSSQNVVATTGVMDLALGQIFTCTVSAATTWSFANVPAARGLTAVLHLTNGGSASVTWPTTVKWPGGTAPSLTAAGIDVIVFSTVDGGANWRANVYGKDHK